MDSKASRRLSLVTQREPIGIAHDGFVIVNVAVFAGGYLNATIDVEIKMDALQLSPALVVAKEQADRLLASSIPDVCS